MHIHCCIQFWCEHFYQWIQATHEVSMSWTPAWFAIVHVLCTDTLTIAMGIEIHQFCSLSLSSYDNTLPFMKYVGVSSLIIMWTCAIETKVKLYICSLNYLDPLNIGRNLKHFNYEDGLVSLERPIEWGMVLLSMLGSSYVSWMDKIENCTVQTIYNFER